MKAINIITYALFIFFVFPAGAQEKYELLYLNNSYDALLEACQEKSTAEAYYWHALVLDKNGNWTEASSLLDTALIQFKENINLENLFIGIQFKLGRYSQITSLLTKHIDYPGNFIKYINILEFRGEYKQAILLLEEKIESDSTNLEYLSHLGDNYFQIDLILSSIETFKKILIINPSDLLSASKLANLYIRTKSYPQSIEICDKGLAIDSTSRKLYRAKGIASNKDGDYETSTKCFQYLYSQGDSSQFVLKNLGISEYYTHSTLAAIEHLELAYKNDSSDFDVCYVLGESYLNTNNQEPGLYYYNQADSLLQPDKTILSTIHNKKQSIYTSLGDFEMAIKSYKTAYNYNPKPEYLFFIASLYQHQIKDKKEAIHYFQSFVDVLPEEGEASKEKEADQLRTISMRDVAERNIEKLKEELFFNGEL